MSRSISFVIDGDVNTQVTITELVGGDLKFDLEVLDTGYIGDLRALFFDLEDFDVDGKTLTATPTLDYAGHITGREIEEGGVDTLGKDANVKGDVSNELGDFDIGIEFGTAGMAEDDIQQTSFVLSCVGEDLSLDMLNLADFGIRYTSVGDEGGARTDSAKIGDVASGVAQNDMLHVDENEQAVLGLLDNDVSGETRTVTAADGFTEVGGVLTADLIVDGKTYGTMVLEPDGTLTVTADGPDADTLAKDETVALDFTYETEAPDGSLATASATVTVTGTNDAPDITAASDTTGTVDEDGEDARIVATGQMVATDVDNAAVLSWSLVGDGIGDFGALTIGATGEWTYTLANDSPQVQALTQADSETETFTVLVMDEHGAVDTETVTITVTGSDDGPVIEDTWVGTENPDVFWGYEGNTEVYGLGGSDRLYGDYYRLYSDYYGSVDARQWYLANQTTWPGAVYEPESSFTPDFGDDLIYAGPGTDVVAGDAYRLVLYSRYADHAVETGADTIEGSIEGDYLYGEGDYTMAYAYYGYDSTVTAGADTITGEAGADVIYGEATYFDAWSYLTGSQTGSDALVVGGNDELSGGADNDVIYGDGLYVRAYSAGSSATGVQTSTVLAGDDVIKGEGGNDIVYGDGRFLSAYNKGLGSTGSADHTIVAGNDDISGGLGADTLYGDGQYGRAYNNSSASDTGSETCVVDGGNDTVSGGDGVDYIYGDFASAYAYGAAQENGTYRVTGGDDDLSGGAGNDVIYGDFYSVQAYSNTTANNTAEVIAGNDTINGGTGNDDLWGDFATSTEGGIGNTSITTGADTFVFDPNCGLDTVHDFEVGKDKLDLVATGLGWGDMDTNGSGAVDAADDFVTAVGGDMVIDLGAAAGGVAGVDTVTLEALSLLMVDDFIFA